MKTTVEHLEDSKVKITISTDASEVDAAIKNAYREAAKKYKFPGFRPGKAPRNVIETALGGQDVILGDATEALINDTFPKALDGEDIRPLGSTTFAAVPEGEEGKIPPVVEGQPFAYSATFDVRPQLTLTNDDDFEIEMPSTAATDEEIDKQLDMLLEQFANLEPVEDRAIETNDFALISFVGDVDGEPYEGNTVDKYLYEMNHGHMPPPFDGGLIGMNPGDEKRIEFAIPDGDENQEFAGKKAGFDVTVHEIKEKVLPEPNDEFAAMMGLEKLDDVRAELAKQITAQKEQLSGRLKEQRSAAELAKRLKGDIPDILIEEKTDELLRDFYRMLQQQNVDPGVYMEQNNLTAEKLRDDMKAQAKDVAAEELALEALYRAKGLEITDADIDDEFRRGAGEKGDPVKLRAEWEEAGLMPMLREGIRRVKAVHWLLDNVKVVEAEPESEKKTKKKLAKDTAKKSSAKKTTKKAADSSEATDKKKDSKEESED